jgi:hypothetical protein
VTVKARSRRKTRRQPSTGVECQNDQVTDELPAATTDARLFGRSAELALFDRLLLGVAAGRGDVLVIRGEPGIGKRRC